MRSDLRLKLRNFIALLFIFAVLCNSCQKRQDTATKLSLTLVQAQKLFTNTKWEPAVCKGISPAIPGFTITQYLKGLRIDLVSETGIYIIYEEFVSSGTDDLPEMKGTLSNIPEINESIFFYYSPIKRASKNYINICGFAEKRMFRIHAWGVKNSADKELDIALELAKHALTNLGNKL